MKLECLVLGKGFCGKKFCEAQANTLGSSHIEGEGDFYFDFTKKETWTNLPECPVNVLITFKIVDLALLKEFYQLYLFKAEQVVAIASAGVYQVNVPNETINEENLVDLEQHPRAQCEDFLKNHGAIILQSGLIWGYGRSFEKWLNSGRIKNSEKLINPIHVDDIVTIMQSFFELNLKAQNVLLCDGKAIKWQKLAEFYGVELASSNVGTESKVLDNSKLLTLIGGYEFKKPIA